MPEDDVFTPPSGGVPTEDVFAALKALEGLSEDDLKKATSFRALDEGNYPARITAITPAKSGSGNPQLVVSLQGRGKVDGRRLPNFYLPLGNALDKSGEKMDRKFWRVARSIIGDEALKEIRVQNASYLAQVNAVCDRLRGDAGAKVVARITKDPDRNDPDLKRNNVAWLSYDEHGLGDVTDL